MTDSMTESVFTCSGELFPWAEKVSTQVFTNPITAWPLPGLSGIPLVSWNAHCKAEEAKMVLCLFSGAPKNCNRSLTLQRNIYFYEVILLKPVYCALGCRRFPT